MLRLQWLKRIEVSAVESQHHLHYFGEYHPLPITDIVSNEKVDNKVLPMQLTPEQAREEREWWFDPKYLITCVSLTLLLLSALTPRTS